MATSKNLRTFFLLIAMVTINNFMWLLYLKSPETSIINTVTSEAQKTVLGHPDNPTIQSEDSQVTCRFEDVPPDIKWLNDEYPLDSKLAQSSLTKCVIPRFMNVNEKREISFNKRCANPGGWAKDMVVVNRAPIPDGSSVDISNERYIRGYCNMSNSLMINMHLQYIQEDYDNWHKIAQKRKRVHAHSNGYLKDYKVYFILADALARDHFYRSCPKSVAFLNSLNEGKVAKFFDFTRFHAVGWHSIHNQLPMLIGHDCTKLHKTFYPAELENEITCNSLITKFYQQHGYVTSMLGEICQDTGDLSKYPISPVIPGGCGKLLNRTCGTDRGADIFNPPYYTCEWYRMAINASTEEPIKPLNSIQCVLPETTLGFIKDINAHLKEYPQFSYTYLRGGHNSVDSKYIQLSLDEPLESLLQSLDLSKSIFVIVSDHGLHFGPHLDSLQGQREHLLPLLLTVFPQSLLQKEPAIAENLERNRHHLVTSWDLYKTMKHIPVYPEDPVATAPFSTSLFDEISPRRTCQEAGIAEAYCSCADWKPENSEENIELVKKYIQHALDEEVNKKLKNIKTACMPITLDSIEKLSYRSSFTNPSGDFLEPIIYFKVYFFGAPGKQRFQLVLRAMMDSSVTKEQKWGIVHKGQPPILAPTASVEYFRRLTLMNEAESQAKKPKGMEVERVSSLIKHNSLLENEPNGYHRLC